MIRPCITEPAIAETVRSNLANALLSVASEDSCFAHVLKRAALQRFALDYWRIQPAYAEWSQSWLRYGLPSRWALERAQGDAAWLRRWAMAVVGTMAVAGPRTAAGKERRLGLSASIPHARALHIRLANFCSKTASFRLLGRRTFRRREQAEPGAAVQPRACGEHEMKKRTAMPQSSGAVEAHHTLVELTTVERFWPAVPG